MSNASAVSTETELALNRHAKSVVGDAAPLPPRAELAEEADDSELRRRKCRCRHDDIDSARHSSTAPPDSAATVSARLTRCAAHPSCRCRRRVDSVV